MKLKIIDGYHLTATERSAIKTMLQNDWTTAKNNPNTKNYQITERTPEQITIKIGSKAVWTIGDVPRWRYSILTIEYTL